MKKILCIIISLICVFWAVPCSSAAERESMLNENSSFAITDITEKNGEKIFENIFIAEKLSYMRFNFDARDIRNFLVAVLEKKGTDKNSIAYGDITYSDLCSSVCALYKKLVNSYGKFSVDGISAENAEKISDDAIWREFAAKLYFLCGEDISYYIYNLTPYEVYAVEEKALENFKGKESFAVSFEDLSFTLDLKGEYAALEQKPWEEKCAEGCDIWAVSSENAEIVRAAVDFYSLHDLCAGIVGTNCVCSNTARYTLENAESVDPYRAKAQGWTVEYTAVPAYNPTEAADIIEKSYYDSAVVSYRKNKGVSVNVLSLNIRCSDDPDGHSISERAPRVYETVKKRDADIVGFQEATEVWMPYLYEYFGDEYEIYNVWRDNSEKESAPVMWKKSKYRCLERGAFWLSDTPDYMSNGYDPQKRICQYVRLLDLQSGKEFVYMNTHYGFIEENQAKSSAVILSFANKISSLPTFLTGDFNAEPYTKGYTALTKRFTDVNAATVNDRSETFHDYYRNDPDDPANQVDYIFADTSITPEEFYIAHENFAGKYASDHYALFARLCIYEETVTAGDINYDGKINIADSNMIKQIILGRAEAAEYIKVADINSDGKINISDGNLLKKIILGQ